MAHFEFVSTLVGAPWGGSEELWSGAALRLLMAGHTVTANVFKWHPDPKQILQLQRDGIAIKRRPRYLPGAARLAYGTLGIPTNPKPFTWRHRTTPQLVVISQSHSFDGVPIMRECIRRNWPYVTVAQANGDALWPNDSEAEEARAGYSGAARAYFVSRHNLSLLSDQIGESLGNAEIVSNPFNIAYHPVVPPIADDGTLRLACIGRLDPVAKGQDLLLHALAKDKWGSRPVHLSFYGDGRCKDVVMRLAGMLNLDRVYFKGHVNDVVNIWAENHALALPSRFEGTPLALIETMLCSRAAIVTDVGGNAELIEDNVSGFVAKAPTVDLIDEALERTWKCRSQLTPMGVAARRRIESCIPEDPVGDFANRLQELV